jgi:hypothetical protein
VLAHLTKLDEAFQASSAVVHLGLVRVLASVIAVAEKNEMIPDYAAVAVRWPEKIRCFCVQLDEVQLVQWYLYHKISSECNDS